MKSSIFWNTRSLLLLVVLIFVSLGCTKDKVEVRTEEEVVLGPVVLGYQSYYGFHLYTIDIDVDGEDDVRFESESCCPNSQGGWSYIRCKALNEQSKVLVVDTISYVCQDSLINYQGSGYDGTITQNCDDVPTTIVDTLDYAFPKIYTNLEGVSTLTGEFRSGSFNIRSSSYAGVYDPFPGFANKSVTRGSPDWGEEHFNYVILEHAGISYAVEIEFGEGQIHYIQLIPL